MNNTELEIITALTPKLLKLIHCDIIFLAKLEAAGVITENENLAIALVSQI